MKNDWKNWALTAMGVILMALAGWAGSSFASRLGAVEQDHAVLKVNVAVMQSDMAQIKRIVERIENKVDKR